ncbi:hypothetical protein BRPE64_BCDS00730 [Caballeronia insecticola]|uniref:Uncharacterized protein n=1 Tax=Caballeronia insecticola TaxID=758793 RepID=R4WK01_9BURK|nr:hypothetical protein BRPE64_BCDS00730 [Caballeronia insecticola]
MLRTKRRPRPGGTDNSAAAYGFSAVQPQLGCTKYADATGALHTVLEENLGRAG